MTKNNIPKVSVVTFLRNAFKILKNPLPFHNRQFEKLGDTFELHLGFGNSVVFSRDAGFLQYALQKNQRNYTKSPIQTKDLAKYVGEGLLTAEGEKWQKQRKLIQPAFHKKQLTLLLETIQQVIDTEYDKMIINKPVDIFSVYNDLAFLTVAKSLFSTSIDMKDIKRVQEITESAQKMLVKELRQPYLHWYFKSFGKIKKNVDLTVEARTILKRIVDQRISGQKRFDDLLDMLLDARYEDGAPMDEEQLIDEILILFTAGHETASNALTFTAQLLSRNPEAQEKILEEIQNIPDQADFMTRIKESRYTQAVVEEAMRMYPPAYFIDRINKTDDHYNDLHFKKGANLLFSVIQIHNNPNLWDRPEKFMPERFINVPKTAYSSFYFPFGAGPRMCIGNNYAMFEMIMAVQSLVKRFQIKKETTPIEIKPLITLKPNNAFLRLEKRK